MNYLFGKNVRNYSLFEKKNKPLLNLTYVMNLGTFCPLEKN
jgi:hypothetical protein